MPETYLGLIPVAHPLDFRGLARSQASPTWTSSPRHFKYKTLDLDRISVLSVLAVWCGTSEGGKGPLSFHTRIFRAQCVIRSL